MIITRGLGGNGAVLIPTRGYGSISAPTPQVDDWICIKNIHHDSFHRLHLRGY